MGKTIEDVMKKAISFLNTKESPANSNNVIFNTHYYGKKVNGSAYPWCCSYVWDVFRLCGASDLFYDGKKTAYCPTVESWGKSKKITIDKSNGKYGDIVLFDFYGKGESCHIGFIVQKNSDGTYKTIEGNTSVGNDDNGGCVMYRTRNQSSIRCIIRPKYETETNAVITKKGNLFKKMNTWNKKICPLPTGADVKVIKDVKNGWSKIQYSGQTGYAKNSHIKHNSLSLSGYATKQTTKKAALRTARNTKKSSKAGSVPAGTKFTLLAKGTKWVYVKYNANYYYIWKAKTTVK